MPDWDHCRYTTEDFNCLAKLLEEDDDGDLTPTPEQLQAFKAVELDKPVATIQRYVALAAALDEKLMECRASASASYV